MKIAFLTTTLDETVGWGRFAAGFLTEARRRHGTENVVTPNPGRLRSGEIRWKQPFLALWDAFRLRKALEGCDVIHAAIEPAAPLAYFLSILLRKPYIVSVCGTFADLDSYSRSVRWLYRRAFRSAARVAVLSRYTLRVFERHVKDAKTTIVYGGFVPSAAAAKKAGISAERRILSVGAIKPRKGFHTLLEALGRLQEKGFAFRADCVGPMDASSYVMQLETRQRELGLENRVTFHGRVSEEALQRFYAEADLFVLPSEHSGTAFEGLGLVYLEAMAQGVPAIGCLESGAEDVIQDGVNGRLVPPGDPETLARAIEEVLSDEQAWKRMSDAAPSSIDRFRWEQVGGDMDAVYRAAAEADAPSGARAAAKRMLLWSEKYAKTDMSYVARGGFWMSAHIFASSAISLAMAVVFANLLPKDVYGYYKYVLSLGGFFGFLTYTGMNAAVSQAVARGQDGAFPYSIRLQLRWNLLFTAALAAAAGYYLLNGSQKLGLPLVFLAVFSPLTSAFTTYAAFLSGKQDFKTASRYAVAGNVLYAIVMCLAVLLTQDVRWLVAVYAASSAGVAFLFHRLTIAKYRPRGLEEGERKKMLSLGTHMTFTNVLGSVAAHVDNLVVFTFGTAPELAVYALANVVPERLKSFMKRAFGIVAPKVAVKTPEEAIRSFPLRLAQGGLVGIALAIAYALAAPLLFTYVFPQYAEATRFSQLIAISMIFVLPSTYGSYVIQAQHLYAPMYVGTTVSNLLRIALIVVGGYFWGVFGVIAARLGAGAFAAAFCLYLYYRALKKLPPS